MPNNWTPINQPGQTLPNMSRQPPLPPGLPPKPVDTYRPGPPRHTRFEDRDRDYDRADDRDYRPPMYQFGSSDDYDRRPMRTRNTNDAYGRRPSPPRNNYNHGYDSYVPGSAPPLRSSSSVYQPSHQPSQYDRGPPGSGEFTFRSEAPSTISQNSRQLYRPSSPEPRRQNRQQNNNVYRRGHGEGRGGYRGNRGPRLASDREFLKGNREPTPEMMPGIDDEDTGVRFKPIEDVSDSDETEMDISDDERGDVELPSKKARTVRKAADGDSVPRWSNPDPYTALPPPDESQRKKKDVVKLIRKARVETNSGSTAKVEAADDFISFDFGEEDPFKVRPPSPDPVVEGAPNGPRFSHAANLHRQQVPAAPTSTQLGNYQVQAQATSQTLQSRPNSQNFDDRFGQGISVQANTDSQGRSHLSNNENVRTSRSAKLDTTSDPALGSRKRNIDDQLKAAPVLHPIGKGKNNKPTTGVVLREWMPRANSASTPWIEIDHSETTNMGLWLHKEIRDFYDYVKPREFESVIRTRLVDDLRARLRQTNAYADADIRTFGSFPAGLYLPTADMDLVCISDEFLRSGRRKFGNSNNFYWRFGDFIRGEDLAVHGSVEIIAKAKVPLVKYIDKLTGLKVDISFENTTGIIANQTFQDWKAQFPAMPVIVTLIKHLLAMRGLNEPVNGGIGGFSVTCLVVSLFQLMPQVQSRSMIPEHHLNEVLMEFLDLYGNQFKYDVNAISLNPPGYISKAHAGMPYNARSSTRLCIIDPNRSENDISGGAANTETVLTCFAQAYNDLRDRMGELRETYPADRRNASILEVILAGNYKTFKEQREHLAYLYEQLYGPLPNGGA